jgi:two-component system nitrogen regulation sensor histidine kinase GlnL
MFETNSSRSVKAFAFVLGLLSLFALIVTAWVLLNVRHEQAIVAQLVSHLQGSDLEVAGELSSELGLQRSLSFLLVLNVIAAGIAFSLVLRGYFSSERNLQDVKVLSTDILASMDAGVITTDMEGRITSLNIRGAELLGSSYTGLFQTIEELGSEHALLTSICRELLEHHQPIRDRDYQILRHGHRKTYRAGCTILRNRQKEEVGMVIHVRDVTEKAFMEERLRRMERYVGLGSLAAGLQHEIKNPLNALSLHIQLLCESLPQEFRTADINETLDILNTEVKRISEVLDGFRNYASIDEIRHAPVDVANLIEKLIRLLRPDAENKKVSIEFQCEESITTQIIADGAKLEQVLLNLALNAVAAMPNGGTLRFHLACDSEMLEIQVSDTGNGIPVEIRNQIFNPYFTTRKDGIGMGLAICEKIVRQHDGRIEFETDANGTTFTIQLPVEQDH